jgi:hypothetical protein
VRGVALLILSILTRAREAPPIPASCEPSCAEQTDRLEPALRLLADVAISF